ncbi:MAG: hypothetical protein Q8M37_02950 [Nevskia sp.]|nr:hypothetical protein [Nevskia sp.]
MCCVLRRSAEPNGRKAADTYFSLRRKMVVTTIECKALRFIALPLLVNP